MKDPLTLLFSVPMVAFHRVLKKAIAKAKVKALELPDHTTMLSRVTTADGNEAWVTTHVPPELELDFLNYRSETYIGPMSFGVAEEMSLWLRGKNKPEPTTEAVLVDYLLHGSGANACRYDADNDVYVAEFNAFHFETWDNSPLDVSRFVFHPEKEQYEIWSKNEQVYRPGDPEWQNALNHVNATLTIGLPAAMHNWVHFSLLEATAEAVHHHLPRQSILGQLLSPHLRFTNRINQQALWVRKSTNATNTRKGRLVPWHAFPMNGPEFADGVLVNTANFYKELTFLNKPDLLDQRIPYFAFLKSYFDIIEGFVRDVLPMANPTETTAVLEALDRYYPGIRDADPVRVFSMVIWLAGVYHYTDHATYCQFARRYGLNRTQGKLGQHLRKNAPAVSTYERFRLRTFLNIFGGFNPNPRLNQRMTNIRAYQFCPKSEAGLAAARFLTALKGLDKHHRQNNTQVVPCHDMVQSVCF